MENLYTQTRSWMGLMKWIRSGKDLPVRFAVTVVFILIVSVGRSQFPLIENYSYPAGTVLSTVPGFTIRSGGGTNAQTVASPGLSYPGYAGSDIGNALPLATSGEDLSFDAATGTSTGSVYLAAMVNVSATQTLGDYFLSMHYNNTFNGKVFAKATSGGFLFGSGKNSAVYESSPARSFNTTYLVVVKYTFNPGANDDRIDFWVNPAVGGTEPPPTLSNITEAARADYTEIRGYVSRQGSATAAPTVRIDGIREATDWATAVAAAGVPTLSTNQATMSGFNYISGLGPSESQMFLLSGNSLDGSPVSANCLTSNYEVSTNDVDFFSSVNIPYSGTTFTDYPVYVRLKAGLAIGFYNTELVSNTGGGAGGVNVTCNGYVLPTPTIYTWTGAVDTDWQNAANWSPNRTLQFVNDILTFSNGLSNVVTNVPAQTIGQLLINSNTSVDLQSSSAITLNINGNTGHDLMIQAGSSLNITQPSYAFILSLNPGTTGDIEGYITFSSAAHRLFSPLADAITFQSGAIFTAGAGFSGSPFGTSVLNSVVFKSGSKYIYYSGSNPFGAAAPNSVVVWQSGSTYVHRSTNSPSLSNRAYANMELDESTGSTLTSGIPVTMDNLIITAGTWGINIRPQFEIRNDITVAPGTTLNFSPTNNSTLLLNGSAPQAITGPGIISTNALQTFSLNNNSTLTLGKDLAINGTLHLQSGIFIPGSYLLTVTGNITGGSTLSYIDGKVEQVFAAPGSKIFPTGKGGNYRPLTVNMTSLTGTSYVSAEQFESPITGTLPPNTSLLTTGRHWTVTQSGGTDLGYYITLDATGYTPTSAVVGLKGDGGTLSAYATTSPDYTNVDALTTFSDFALGECIPLVEPAGAFVDRNNLCANDGGNIELTYTGGSGSVLKWYADGCGSGTSIGSGNNLVIPAPVLTTTYYARWESDPCPASACASITVTVYPVPAAPSGAAIQNFCTGANPTVASLQASGSAILWYDMATGGTPLSSSDPLTATTYYASQTINGCESTDRLAVSVTINPNPAAPTGLAEQKFCVGSNPTVSDLMATGANILWYSDATGGSPLGTGTMLITGTHYHASQTVDGCESLSRLDVLVTISTDPPVLCEINGKGACGNTGNLYSAPAGMSSYSWNITSGPAQISGSTNSQSVSVTTTATSGSFTLVLETYDQNNCYSSCTRNITIGGPVTTIASPSVCQGTPTVDVPVKVSSFANVGSISLHITYDQNTIANPAVVYTNPAMWTAVPPGYDGFVVNTTGYPGEIVVSGFGAGITLPDNDIMFTLRFEIVGGPTYTSLQFLENPQGTYCEYAPDQPPLYSPFCDEPFDQFYIAGGVLINPVPAPPVGHDVTACFDNNTYTGSATAGTGEEVVWYDAPHGGNVMTAPSGTLPGVYSAWAAARITATGCESASRTLVTVTIHPLRKISGSFTYYNLANTPLLSGITVKLYQSGTQVGPDFTVTDGTYEFNGLCPGTYELRATSSEPTDGSVNTTDAAQVNFWPAGPYVIEKVRFHAGDVGTFLPFTYPDWNLTATDAARIQQHFVNGRAFDRNWTFWQTGEFIANNPATSGFPVVVLPAANDVIADMYGLCTGDFNRSFTPGSMKSSGSSLALVHSGNRKIAMDEEFELPVLLMHDALIGAVSIILYIPEGMLEVKDVSMNATAGLLDWAVRGDELRIGWNSPIPARFYANDVLLTLKLKVTGVIKPSDMIRITLASNPLNELADGSYQVIEGAVISLDALESSPDQIGEIGQENKLTLRNFPNPFNESTVFGYSLPFDGEVLLEIRNALGEMVAIPFRGIQHGGEHLIRFEPGGLPQGVYLARLSLKGNTDILRCTVKIVINK